MELRLLRSFQAIAEHSHFGRAARALHVSQPALSKQLVQLEEEIGAPLFDRGRHGARLTPVGETLLADAAPLLRHADGVLDRVRRAARGETGALRLGFGVATRLLVPRLVSNALRLGFGVGAYVIPVVVLLWAVTFFVRAVRVDEARRPDLKVPAGRVLAQDPAPGLTTRRQRSVRVWLSAGPRNASVPLLSGETERAAQARRNLRRVAGVLAARDVGSAEVRAAATDPRNEVKKAVNWALRQIGKRNRALHGAAIAEAEVLLALEDRTARWIARDALRELRNPATIARIRR